MDPVEPVPHDAVSRPRHWLLFFAGVLLFVLGPAAYAMRLREKHLETPWYLPILASAAVAFMAVSIWRRRGVVRTILLVLFALLCGFEWFVLGVGMKSPAYTGPAQPGRKVPQFTASLADGTPFTEKDLEQGTTTALVFYRGHW